MASDRTHPPQKLSLMKKTLFVALFLTIATFSFAKSSNAHKTSVKKDATQNIQVEKQIQDNNRAVIVSRYKDECGQMLTVTLYVYCCLSDTDIAALVDELAMTRFNYGIGCFE